MGVVSGIVMPFQFGTNWSRFSDATANVVAPLMAYEGLTAFFLEAAFLGVLLFGRKLVPQWVHFVAAVMVALGTLFTTFWILAANSWMQTPAGFEIVDGRFVPDRLASGHVQPVVPVSARAHGDGGVPHDRIHRDRRRRVVSAHGRFVEEARVMIAMGVLLASVLVPAQVVIGDLHGLNTLAHQPRRSPRWKASGRRGPDSPPCCSRFPTRRRKRTTREIAIPKLASLYPHARSARHVQGPQGFPEGGPAAGGARVLRLPRDGRHVGDHARAHASWAWWLAWRKRLFTTPRFLRAATWAIPVGYIAVTAGWITTEVGRQPWVVYGHLRTADAVTPTISGGEVLASLLAYVVVYLDHLRLRRRTTSCALVQRGPPEQLEAHEPRLTERAGAAALGGDRAGSIARRRR